MTYRHHRAAGATEPQTSAQPKQVEGHRSTPAPPPAVSWFQNVAGETIAADETLTAPPWLTSTIDRQVYNVTYRYTNEAPAGATELPAAQAYRYGDTFTVAPAATATGYVFSGWSQQGTVTVAGDVEITGSWSAATDTRYTVKHWFQNVAGEEYSQDASLAADETLTGTTGEQTSAQPKQVEGFNAKAVSQETIAADGSTVVNVYYDRQVYNVTYRYTNEAPAGASPGRRRNPHRAARRPGLTATATPSPWPPPPPPPATSSPAGASRGRSPWPATWRSPAPGAPRTRTLRLTGLMRPALFLRAQSRLLLSMMTSTM